MGLAPLLGQPHIGHRAHVIARVTVHPVHRRPMVAPNAIDLVGSREMRFLKGQITVHEWLTFNHRSTSLGFLPLSSLHLSDLHLISPSLGSPPLISLHPLDLPSHLFHILGSPISSLSIPRISPSHLSSSLGFPLSSLSIPRISPLISLYIPRISPSHLSPYLGSRHLISLHPSDLPLCSLSIPRISPLIPLHPSDLSLAWSPSLGSPFLGSLLSVPRITDLRSLCSLPLIYVLRRWLSRR